MRGSTTVGQDRQTENLLFGQMKIRHSANRKQNIRPIERQDDSRGVRQRNSHREKPWVAGTVWNAGFSRHSPPKAGGETNLIRRDGSAALANAPGVTTNRLRPCGPRCRLKPAFQAGGAITAVGQPRETALSQQARADRVALFGRDLANSPGGAVHIAMAAQQHSERRNRCFAESRHEFPIDRMRPPGGADGFSRAPPRPTSPRPPPARAARGPRASR